MDAMSVRMGNAMTGETWVYRVSRGLQDSNDTVSRAMRIRLEYKR